MIHPAAALALVLALIGVPTLVARPNQEPPTPPHVPPRSIDGLLDAVYELVSFPAGEVPDWDALRALMLPEALIVQPTERGRGVRTMTVSQFVAAFVEDIESYDMSALGFEERIVGREVTRFGDIAHAFVVFEARLLAGERTEPQRGLDSFQLVHRDDRWWIASIATQFERPDDPVPERLLPE